MHSPEKGSKEVKRTKNIRHVRFGLFCVLLLVIVIEFIVWLSFNSLSPVLARERVGYYLSLLTNLGLAEKVIIIVLLGALAFPTQE